MPVYVELDLILYVRDEASARLMILKAQCLLQAGLIDAREACAVFHKASEILYQVERQQAA